MSAARSRPAPADPAARRPPVADAAARADVAAALGLRDVPATPGRDTDRRSSPPPATASSAALVVGGVDPADLPDPALAEAALAGAGFLVSLELRPSRGHRAGRRGPAGRRRPPRRPARYLDWEGRAPPVRRDAARHRRADRRPGAHALADEMDVDLRLPTPSRRPRAELAAARAPRAVRPRASASTSAAGRPAPPAPARRVLATWHQLIDAGTPAGRRRADLAGTARPAVARICPRRPRPSSASPTATG